MKNVLFAKPGGLGKHEQRPVGNPYVQQTDQLGGGEGRIYCGVENHSAMSANIAKHCHSSHPRFPPIMQNWVLKLDTTVMQTLNLERGTLTPL